MKNRLIIAAIFFLSSITGFAQDGVWDSTFANNGRFIKDVNTNDVAYDIIPVSNGKYIIASSGGWQFNAFCLNNNGTLNANFGTGGFFNFGSLAYGRGGMKKSNGKILLFGEMTTIGYPQMTTVQIDENGIVDASYGTNGVARYTVSTWDTPLCGVPLPGGECILGGYSGTYTENRFTVIKCKANGALDQVFATNGIFRFLGGSGTTCNTIGLDSSGKILAAGNYKGNGAEQGIVIKMKANGMPDSAFSTTGIKLLSLPPQGSKTTISKLLATATGKYLVCGYTELAALQRMYVACLLGNGELDTEFGSNGIFSLPESQLNGSAATLCVQNDGKIIVIGAELLSGQNNTFILRLNQDGKIDSTFGSNGISRYSLSNYYEGIYTAVILNNEQLFISGHIESNTGNYDYFVGKLRINPQPLTHHGFSLKKGWNLLSIPLTSTNMQVAGVFPNINNPVYQFNNGYSAVATLSNGTGYWLKSDTNQSVEMSGYPATGIVNLKAGWNMIGGYNDTVNVVNFVTTPPNIINSQVYAYQDGYQTAQVVQPGKGYWVRAVSNGTLTFNSVAKRGEQAISTEEINAKTVLVFTDSREREAKLFLEAGIENLERYSLPPVPPAGEFDVRLSTNSQIAAGGEEDKLVLLQGVQYPLVVRCIGGTARIQLVTNSGMTNKRLLIDGQSIEITDESIISISNCNSDLIPASFFVEQNFPNPFNPSTTISFGLPERARVSVEVFNLVGEKISELCNEIREAGVYAETWHAEGFPSGIYLCRINYGQKQHTIKMLLLK